MSAHGELLQRAASTSRDLPTAQASGGQLEVVHHAAGPAMVSRVPLPQIWLMADVRVSAFEMGRLPEAIRGYSVRWRAFKANPVTLRCGCDWCPCEAPLLGDVDNLHALVVRAVHCMHS